jgi:hypothetical protein
MKRSKVAPALGFLALLAAFWFVGAGFGIQEKLGGHVGSAMLSFALLLAPYWAFGFGFGEWLHARVRGAGRTLAPLLLIVPYLIFALPRGEFRWDMCLGMAAVVLAVSLLAPYSHADWLVLAILGVSVDLHFFARICAELFAFSPDARKPGGVWGRLAVHALFRGDAGGTVFSGHDAEHAGAKDRHRARAGGDVGGVRAGAFQ